MPGSAIQGKENIKEWLNSKSDIKTIVDVGAGSATYPKLLGKQYNYIAIEIWAPYIERFNLEQYYSKIIIGDVRYVDLPRGDCIIFGDVLEHMSKKDALEVFFRANKQYKHIILSIPVNEDGKIIPSKVHYGNKYEKHISGWTFKEVEGLTFWKHIVHSRDIAVFFK